MVLGQKMKRVACGVVLRIDSWDLHTNRFFVENKTRFLLSCGSLVVSSLTKNRFSPPRDLRARFRAPQLVMMAEACTTTTMHKIPPDEEISLTFFLSDQYNSIISAILWKKDDPPPATHSQ
jgi:hypothetical protein